METKSIEIHIGDETKTIVVQSVNKKASIRRAELMAAATKMPDDDMTKATAFFLLPTCLCCVKDPPEVRDWTLDQFMEVDEQDIDAWMAAAYEVNPQWKAGMKMLGSLSAEEEKKTLTSADGSATPTET